MNLRGIEPSNYANLLKQEKRLHKKRVEVVHSRTDKHTDKVLQTVSDKLVFLWNSNFSANWKNHEKQWLQGYRIKR